MGTPGPSCCCSSSPPERHPGLGELEGTVWQHVTKVQTQPWRRGDSWDHRSPRKLLRKNMKMFAVQKTGGKSSETQNWFFEKTNTIDKLLARETKGKRKNTKAPPISKRKMGHCHRPCGHQKTKGTVPTTQLAQIRQSRKPQAHPR